ncbi:MAG: HNH endonuclease [Chloroflexi bacterium]|nr:HNH endonuclease [Chloroflexota bacterium]
MPDQGTRISADNVPHGTVNAYTHHHCRCDECRAAWREYKNRYNAGNRESVRAAYRRNRAANPEAARERERLAKRRYRAKHGEKTRAARRRWDDANRDTVRAHVAKRRARIRGVEVRPFPRQWIATLVFQQGGLCNGCRQPFGETMPPTLDHVHPISKGGPHAPENTQALCLSCNAAKGAKVAA